MLELLRQWRYTRMVALTALVAAVYAAVLIPFKIATVIPGFTEVRPGSALPVPFSFLFGPAAGWGAAIGNTVGDVLGGTFGPGSVFGFLGNLVYGYLPYRLWAVLRGGSPVPGGDGTGSWFRRHLGWGLRFLLVTMVASLACAVFVAWGVEAMNLFPMAFRVLAPLIFLNNLVMAAVLGPPLLLWIHPRVDRLGLLYGSVMEREDLQPAWAGSAGFAFLAGGLGAALAIGLLVPSPAWAMAPFVAVALAGLILV